MTALKVRAQLEPRHGARPAKIVSVAEATEVTSMRCAIHGTVMNYLRKSTYFCAECLGIAPGGHIPD